MKSPQFSNLSLLSFLAGVLAFCSPDARADVIFEDSFADGTEALSKSWKVSADSSLIAEKDGHLALTADETNGHALSQIIRASPAFYFLQPGAPPLSIAMKIGVSATQGSPRSCMARILIAPPLGTKRTDSAILYLTASNEYRLSIMVDGKNSYSSGSFKHLSTALTKLEIIVDATDITVKFFLEGAAEPVVETAPHGFTQANWSSVDTTALAVGALSGNGTVAVVTVSDLVVSTAAPAKP